MRKKIIILIVAIIVTTMLFTSCVTTPNPWLVAEKDAYAVDILQLVEHSALDLACNGFMTELDDLLQGVDKTVTFNLKYAQGSTDTCTTIATQFKTSSSDLVLTIATPAATAAAAVITDKPILFTAVTDAEEARLVESNEAPGFNVSGTSDDNKMVKEQLELIKMLVPGISKIAFVYNTGEVNSVAQLATVQTEAGKLGLEVVKKGITDANEISNAITSIDAADVGAIYLPTDNLIANAAENVHTANQARTQPLPIVAAETGINDACGIATYAISYYELGKQTARMAYKILVEGADISKMPVEWATGTPEISINQEVADAIGFTIPQAVLDLLVD